MGNTRQKIALALCFDDQGRILVARRPADRILGGFWEFPGGKIAPGESPQVAAIRELMEETGHTCQAVGALPPFDWDYPHAGLRFFPIICRLLGQPTASDSTDQPDVRWVEPGALDEHEFPPANAQLIARLRERGIP